MIKKTEEELSKTEEELSNNTDYIKMLRNKVSNLKAELKQKDQSQKEELEKRASKIMFSHLNL